MEPYYGRATPPSRGEHFDCCISCVVSPMDSDPYARSLSHIISRWSALRRRCPIAAGSSHGVTHGRFEGRNWGKRRLWSPQRFFEAAVFLPGAGRVSHRGYFTSQLIAHRRGGRSPWKLHDCACAMIIKKQMNRKKEWHILRLRCNDESSREGRADREAGITTEEGSRRARI